MKKALANTRVSVKLRKSEYREEWYLYVEAYRLEKPDKPLHTNTILHGILICEVLLKLAYWPVLFSLLRSFI